MEDAAIGDTPYPFDGEGDNVVVKPTFIPNSPSPAGRGRGGGSAPEETRDLTDALPHPQPLPAGEGLIGRVYINPTQYFDAVPEIAWGFPIGGYTPAQKWLKDHRGRALGWDDIRHYQKIIRILTETDRIMRKIELPLD
jgi:hypothetical protein